MKLDNSGGFEDEMLRAAMRQLHRYAGAKKSVWSCSAVCKLVAKTARRIFSLVMMLLLPLPLGCIGPVVGVVQLAVFLFRFTGVRPRSAIQYLRFSWSLFSLKFFFLLALSTAGTVLPLIAMNVSLDATSYWTSTALLGAIFTVVVCLMCLIHHVYFNLTGITSNIHEVRTPHYLRPDMKLKFLNNYMAIVSICTVFLQYVTLLKPETIGLQSVSDSPVLLVPSFSLPSTFLSARSRFFVEWWFGIAIVLSWFGVGALLTYLFNAGKTDVLGRFPSISAVVGLFSNTLYFVALTKILRTVSCSSFPGHGFVFRYPLEADSLDVFELECWGSEHRGIVYISIITTVFFALSLTLISPFFVEDLTGRTEFQFNKAYTQRDRIFKTVIVVLKVSNSATDSFENVYCTVVALACACDVYFLTRPGVCSYPPIAYFKATLSVCIAYAAIVELTQSLAPSDNAALMLLSGWAAVALCSVCVQLRWCSKHKQQARKVKSKAQKPTRSTSLVGKESITLAIKTASRFNMLKRSKSQINILTQQTQMIRRKMLGAGKVTNMAVVPMPRALLLPKRDDTQESAPDIWWCSTPLMIESHRGMILTATKQRAVNVCHPDQEDLGTWRLENAEGDGDGRTMVHVRFCRESDGNKRVWYGEQHGHMVVSKPGSRKWAVAPIPGHANTSLEWFSLSINGRWLRDQQGTITLAPCKTSLVPAECWWRFRLSKLDKHAKMEMQRILDGHARESKHIELELEKEKEEHHVKLIKKMRSRRSSLSHSIHGPQKTTALQKPSGASPAAAEGGGDGDVRDDGGADAHAADEPSLEVRNMIELQTQRTHQIHMDLEEERKEHHEHLQQRQTLRIQIKTKLSISK